MNAPATLVTFGDSVRYAGTLRRIETAAREFPGFARVYAWNESDLAEDFRQDHANFIATHPRGYGYWIWKPQVILQAMERVPLGEYIVYADAGSAFKHTPAAMLRFQNYLQMAETHTSDMLTFALGHPLVEAAWTKMDTVAKVFPHPSGDDELKRLLLSPQIMATIIIFKNTDKTQAFVKEWRDMCTCKSDGYMYVTDEPSKFQNLPIFNEHRHDQSIFSLLCKKHGCQSIPDETWHRDWDAQEWPLHAARIRF
jgi:hypothetical protein